MAGGARTIGEMWFVMPSLIGRFVKVVYEDPDGVERVLEGNILDEVPGERLPKRVRVQSTGQFQGKVLMPGEYEILKFL